MPKPRKTRGESPSVDECQAVGCSRRPYYEDGLCRECHELLLSRQYRRAFWTAIVRRGTTAKSMRLQDDAQAEGK